MTQKEFDEFKAFVDEITAETGAEIKHFSEIMNTGELGIEAMKYMGALVQRNKNHMDAMKKSGEDDLELIEVSTKSIQLMIKASELLKFALVGLILVDAHFTGGDEK